jgi:hypothetical protein
MFQDCWMSGEYAGVRDRRRRRRLSHPRRPSEHGPRGHNDRDGAYGAIISRPAPVLRGDGRLGHVDIIGVDVEGWNKSPAIHAYDQGPLTVIGCSFLPTVGGANAASNIVRHEDYKNTNLFFANNSLTGTLTGPAAVVAYTSGRDRGTLVE